MKEVQSTFQRYNLKNFYFLGAIIVVGIAIRLFYLPENIPLTVDSLKYFLYASDFVASGNLPESVIITNNGWSIFLSFWFNVIPLNETMQLMELQRLLAIILSSLTAIPVYYLCKKFVEPKYAIFGSVLFVFDPRLILNSIAGVSESLYILLGATSLILLLKNERRAVILSFILASFCTMVRGEGIFFFFAIVIIFFIKNKFSKNSFKTIIPAVGIFFLILIPILLNRIDVIGSDGIFMRAVAESGSCGIHLCNLDPEKVSELMEIYSGNQIERVITGIEFFSKFLIWIMIPNFLLFAPFGLFLFFKRYLKKENFVIIFLLAMSIPALYAYSIPAQDTRYLYFLFPVLSIISAIAVKEYFSKFKKVDYFLVIIIFGLIVSSVIFYEFKKDDWRMNNEIENERINIAKDVNKIADGINHHPTLGRYIWALQIPSEPPIYYEQISIKTNLISINENSLEEFIGKNKNRLTHIISDNESNIPEFLIQVHHNESNYEYLELVYDSKNQGYNQEFKVYKINYEKIDLKN